MFILIIKNNNKVRIFHCNFKILRFWYKKKKKPHINPKVLKSYLYKEIFKLTHERACHERDNHDLSWRRKRHIKMVVNMIKFEKGNVKEWLLWEEE